MSRILVIDDDARTGELAAALLRQFGYDASRACGGNAGLEQLTGKRPDLVLLDMMMPDMNGLDVLRRIRTDPRTTDIPVVMYSALDDEEWREKAEYAGASGYWIKGEFDAGELEERVRQQIQACEVC